MHLFLAANTRTLAQHWAHTQYKKESGKAALRHHLLLTQSMPMIHYLQIAYSMQIGVCMAISTVFPQQLVSKLYQLFFSNKEIEAENINVFSKGSLHMRIASILESTLFKHVPDNDKKRDWKYEEQNIKKLNNEIFKNAQQEKLFASATYAMLMPDEQLNKATLQTRILQLSSILSKLFDDYQVYRSDMLKKWQRDTPIFKQDIATKNKKITAYEITNFQHALWRLLRSTVAIDLKNKKIPHNACEGNLKKLQQLNNLLKYATTNKNKAQHLCDIFYKHYLGLTIFGVTHLPPDIISMLELLSKVLKTSHRNNHTLQSNAAEPITIYLLACCQNYKDGPSSTENISNLNNFLQTNYLTKISSVPFFNAFLKKLHAIANVTILPPPTNSSAATLISEQNKKEKQQSLSQNIFTLLKLHFTQEINPQVQLLQQTTNHIYSLLHSNSIFKQKAQKTYPNNTNGNENNKTKTLPPLIVLKCENKSAEAETLSRLLLQFLTSNKPDEKLNTKTKSPLEANDILVMCPNVNAYSNELINAFTSHGLPFSIADELIVNSDAVASELLELLNSLTKPITPKNFHTLLQGTFLQKRYKLENVQNLVSAAFRIFHIRNSNENDDNSLANNNTYSFEKGIARIFKQYTQINENENLGISENFTNINITNGQAQSLATIFSLLTELQIAASQLKKPQSIVRWMGVVKKILQDFLVDSSEEAANKVVKTLHSIEEEANLGQHKTPIAFKALLPLLAARLEGAENQRGFMLGHITISSLVPMRAIPFKIICLLGVDEHAFPRRTSPQPLNQILVDPRPSDRNIESDDTQTFYESFLCAEERIIISYCQHNEENDKAEKVVSELTPLLQNALTAALGIKYDSIEIIKRLTLDKHALQWLQFSSFKVKLLNLEHRLQNESANSKQTKIDHFYWKDAPLWEIPNKTEKQISAKNISKESRLQPFLLTPDMLTKFFSNPLNFAKKQEQVELPFWEERELYENEPLEKKTPINSSTGIKFVGDFSTNSLRQHHLQSDLFWQQPEIVNTATNLLELPHGIVGKKLLQETNERLKEIHNFCKEICGGFETPPFAAKKTIVLNTKNNHSENFTTLSDSCWPLMFTKNEELTLFSIQNYFSEELIWQGFFYWLTQCLLLNSGIYKKEEMLFLLESRLTPTYYPKYINENEKAEIQALLNTHNKSIINGHFVAYIGKTHHHFSFKYTNEHANILNNALYILIHTYLQCVNVPPNAEVPLLPLLPTWLSKFLLKETSSLQNNTEHKKCEQEKPAFFQELVEKKFLAAYQQKETREKFWQSNICFINEFIKPLFISGLVKYEQNTQEK